MGIPLRKLWKNKPKQWGPASLVQSGLFNAAERLGIDPASCQLALPMWGAAIDYVNGIRPDSVLNAKFVNNTLALTAGYVHMPSGFPITNPWSVLVRCTGTVRNQYVLGWGSISPLKGAPHIGHHHSLGYRLASWGGGQIDDMISWAGVLDFAGTKKTSGNSLAKKYFQGKLLNSGDLDDSTLFDSSGYIGAVSNGGSPWTGTIDYVLCFNAELSSDQIALLSDNPYQLWQPVPQKTYFIPSEATPTILPIYFNHYNKNIGT